ncbi:MAG: hypothetical protein ABI672_10230 [Vicinamibacteria bacterium]
MSPTKSMNPALALFSLLFAAPLLSAQTAPANRAVVAPSVVPAQSLAPAPARNFDKEVRLMFRMVACAGAEPVPTALQAVVAAHCEAFQPIINNYKTKYLPTAQTFLTSLQPKGLSETVVYPFGGGDLLSALTTYPNLREVTTLSLEHVGDPRVIDGISAKNLELGLQKVRRRVSGLLIWTESTSENMIQLEVGEIPGQLAFFLVGLAVHDQEPVGLRFFDIAPDGSVQGISAQQIEARKKNVASKLNRVWKAPSFSDAFSNSEITFRKAGDPKASLRIHRHIAADLSNVGFKKDPEVLKYLQSRGQISAMTKAASYLLWSSDFSAIRNYLLGSMDFMLSDSTGIPPQYSRAAGFDVVAYGKYTGPFLAAPSAAAKDMLDLYTAQPENVLKFRYGYPDNNHHDHLMVVRKAEKQRALTH